LIRPDDKQLLHEGFLRLSPETRYLRFHGVKTDLTDAELRYLTEIDGVHHVAIGAIAADEGIGVARLIELPAEPGVAESAITVADGWQGRGLGRILFDRIMAAASERAIRCIRCHVLGSNQPMQELLRALGDTRTSIEQGVATIEVALPTISAPRESGLYELLRLAAKRVLSFRGP
jgi:GNAT superfamily N-acetyltransferase